MPPRAKRNDPEEMHAYPGHPEEEIELADYGQQQNQQREVAVGRGINQFFETGSFAIVLALHEAHKRSGDKIPAGKNPARENANKRRYDRDLVGRKWSTEKNFRQIAAEWAIKKAIDDSIGAAAKRCPKAALGFVRGSRISDQYGNFSRAHPRDTTRRHCNRQPSVISRKQLASTFDYLLKVRCLDQHRSVNEEGGFVEFWYC